MVSDLKTNTLALKRARHLHLPLNMKFSFENLEVYQRSIEWVKESEKIVERSRNKISRSLADQLTRAAISVPLNIAEGNGRWHKGDKRNFFWIARGSVFECVPIIEILKIKDLISDPEYESLRAHLEILGKMLTRLIQVHREPEDVVAKPRHATFSKS